MPRDSQPQAVPLDKSGLRASPIGLRCRLMPRLRSAPGTIAPLPAGTGGRASCASSIALLSCFPSSDERGCLLAVSDSPHKIAVASASLTPPRVSDRILRVQLDASREVGDSASQITRRLPKAAALSVRSRVGRIQRDEGCVVRKRGVLLALHPVPGSATSVRPRVRRILFDRQGVGRDVAVWIVPPGVSLGCLLLDHATQSTPFLASTAAAAGQRCWACVIARHDPTLQGQVLQSHIDPHRYPLCLADTTPRAAHAPAGRKRAASAAAHAARRSRRDAVRGDARSQAAAREASWGT